MVNLGPSKGCRRCRARKVKCDETQPSCQRCAKANICCPGYDAFRDQTELIKRKTEDARQKQDPVLSRPYDWPSSIDTINKMEQHDPNRLILPAIAEDPEFNAISFLLTYMIPLTPGYFTAELHNVYSEATVSSALGAATKATALSFTALDPTYRHLRPLASERYIEALRLMREGTHSMDVVKSDEFFTAALMLGMYEYSKHLAAEPFQNMPHSKGAIALAQLRPPSHFQTRLSSILLHQARAELIFRALENADTELLNLLPDTFGQWAPHHASQEDFHDTDFFCGLAELAADQASIWRRCQELLNKDPHDKVTAEAAWTLIEDARLEDARMVSWPLSPQHLPPRVYDLPNSKRSNSTYSSSDYEDDMDYEEEEDNEDEQPYKPKRLLHYNSPTQAAVHASFRLCRAHTLNVINTACDILLLHQNSNGASPSLNSSSFSSPTATTTPTAATSSDILTLKLSNLNTITILTDDVCAGIPLYLGWVEEDLPPSFLSHNIPIAAGWPPPVTPAVTTVPYIWRGVLDGAELIANWSQMMPIIRRTVRLEYMDGRRREWMGRYLRVFEERKGMGR